MIFSLGSEFVFGSWVRMADDEGKLQAHLMKIEADQAPLAQSEDALDDLVEKIQDFSIFDSTTICSDEFKSYSDSVTGVLPRLSYGLRNSASIYQESGSGMFAYGQ